MSFLALAGSLALAGAQQPLVFSASTELVHVVVSVTDEMGQPIRGLQTKDFTVHEDGKKRPVVSFAACGDLSVVAATECPVDLVMLWDTSTSMLDSLRRARDAALKFVDAVPAANGRTVVAFDSDIKVAAYDPARPTAVFDEILSGQVGGETRLFDAIREGVARATNDPTRRVIMVALTDGEDSNERASVKEVANALQNAAISFYAIAFSEHLLHEAREKRARDNLQILARSTGGLVIDGEAPDMNSQFDVIRRDISTQYVLGFEPGTSAPGRAHDIKIHVATKGAKIRHRLEYQTR